MSGYVAKGGTNAFAQVQGDFVQPTIQSGCANNTYESTWVGLGGYNSGKLVQTGTAMILLAAVEIIMRGTNI